MKRALIGRFLNLVLRGVTLVSKFLLIVLLARFLEPADLGLFGLLTVTISYSIFLVGFDFYIFTTREILKSSANDRGRLLKGQIGFSLILYCVFVPLCVSLFTVGLLPWWLLPWFLILLIFEHVAQELNRILVALSRQVIASWVLFFRAGAWCLVVLAIMYLDPEYRSLQTVLVSWIIGSVMAVAVGLLVVFRQGLGGWQLPVDWNWVKKGVRITVPMLIATLALRGIYTFDRYWIEALTNLEVLGVYVLFMGICNALLAFMDAAVFTFLYPAMIVAHTNQDARGFRIKFRQLTAQTITLTLFFSMVAWIVVPFLLEWLDRPVFSEYQYLFLWLLVANMLTVLGMIPHYGLYAQGNDKPLVVSHIAGLIVFVLTTALSTLFSGELAVPLGLIAASGFILFWKTLQFFRLTPPLWR
ncbi:lipopolysaccharide biosynthesis protein [Marinobacter arenosus]|uniref:lipopolysaccharide biosynthesis protein n=1 Tax=Marinobacter arenosus TaxID=2856822 RepID=UPI001C4AA978|nr:oligosaccharide flippase family protein [Marinobacter arenosus]MBW0146821.1 oligosaccharide flippase family protein [Marinobacter arenosus]